jgi:LPS-assembly lipoprotein
MPIFRMSHSHITALVTALVCAIALTACGFQMRGVANLSFSKLYIQGPTLTITKDLVKLLKVNGVTIVTDPKKAELMLEMMSETNEKRILSLSGGGLVREYELFYHLNFRLRDPSSEVWGETLRIEERRDFSYDDSQLLAKQFEEASLIQDMKTDAIRELMRLLVVQKPKPKAIE